MLKRYDEARQQIQMNPVLGIEAAKGAGCGGDHRGEEIETGLPQGRIRTDKRQEDAEQDGQFVNCTRDTGRCPPSAVSRGSPVARGPRPACVSPGFAPSGKNTLSVTKGFCPCSSDSAPNHKFQAIWPLSL